VFNKILPIDPKAAGTQPTSTAPTQGSTATNLSTPMADPISGKNVLSADVEIKGSIKFTNELIIDGKVEGEITSAGVLTVGENAEIRGEIKTKSVTVFGKVHGNITVDERCELKARAVLQGDLKAARLVIEEGATFVGKSEVTPNKTVAMKQPEVVRNPEPQKQQAAGAR
jgi:cytoskeletal protein CcmA (bactofilin family)